MTSTKITAEQVRSLCPQCGWDVSVDEDGCCTTCGADALGEGVDAATRKITELRTEIDALRTHVELLRKALQYAEWGG